MLAGEGEPEQVMTDRGLAVVRDDSLIQAAVDEALAANPDVAEKIRGGKVQAAGAIVGAVMKATKGQADAARVRELVLLPAARRVPARQTHRRHRELLEALARIGLGVVDRQSAEHLGERQHGVAQKRGIQAGQSRVQRDAGLGQQLGLGEDRRTRASQVIAVFAGSAVRQREDQPPAGGILQDDAQERRDRGRVGARRSGHRQVLGHPGEHLIEPASVLTAQQCRHQLGPSPKDRVQHRLSDTGGFGHRLHAQLVQLASGEHRHGRVQELLAPLFRRQSGRVLAPQCGRDGSQAAILRHRCIDGAQLLRWRCIHDESGGRRDV